MEGVGGTKWKSENDAIMFKLYFVTTISQKPQSASEMDQISERPLSHQTFSEQMYLIILKRNKNFMR